MDRSGLWRTRLYSTAACRSTSALSIRNLLVSQNTRLTKIGNVYLRYYFILGANLLRQHNLEYKAYYWRKYQEVSKYQHKRSLVLTARKLVRLVHALLTKNVPYVRPRMTDPGQEDDGLQ